MFRELYKYRSLMREIVVKNIKIQYRSSVLGIFWTLLQPLLTTLVLVFIFGELFWRNREYNFPLYVLTGRLLYEFYSQSTKRAMRSVTGSASVIKKVKMPKYIYPLSNVISNFVTFLISMLVLVGFLAYFLIWPSEKNPAPALTWNALYAPVPLFILFLLCIGVGLILSTLAVFFKDIEYIYDVFCMLLFYATPIIYEVTPQTKQALQYALKFNPLYSIVAMFRDCVLYGGADPARFPGWPFNPHHLLYALGCAVALIVVGALAFWRKQDKFILYI